MATETAKAEQAETASDSIIMLFDLENAAVAGRKVLYDILKKHLQAAGVQLNRALFARYGLKPTPEQDVASLLENAASAQGDAAKIGQDVRAALVAELRDKAEVNAAVLKLLEAAHRKGVMLGALSALDEEDAAPVLQRLGLKAEVRLLAQRPAESNYPHADVWIRLLKMVSKSSRPAVAVVSSQAACKSALSAGLRVIALPDEFTSHQDFGGADYIIDDPKDLDVPQILNTLAAD